MLGRALVILVALTSDSPLLVGSSYSPPISLTPKLASPSCLQRFIGESRTAFCPLSRRFTGFLRKLPVLKHEFFVFSRRVLASGFHLIGYGLYFSLPSVSQTALLWVAPEFRFSDSPDIPHLALRLLCAFRLGRSSLSASLTLILVYLLLECRLNHIVFLA